MTKTYKSIWIIGPNLHETYDRLKDLYMSKEGYLIIGDGNRNLNEDDLDILKGKISADTRIDIFMHGAMPTSDNEYMLQFNDERYPQGLKIQEFFTL